uniref:Glycoside hydrolase family 5 domain-containing protein n=1 Tax=Kalanchoe fedtschenkoi TaxID=63787 RepID=A0A7N0VI13_KALFE
MLQRHLLILSLFSLLLTASLHALPLSTRSRWIINALSGNRVKLSCVNWAGHLEVMVPEGLDKQPLQDIAAKVASLGFNCVRLTWATHMFTQPNNTKLTVSESFESLGLLTARAGVSENNPSLLNLTLVEAQVAVVDELGKHGVMVVLDNHVSKPMWCCSDNDGNGFFGDRYFDPAEWLHGLNLVAGQYRGKSQVVAMSLRNELRGPRQNELDWHRYMQDGATTIHSANPDLLVIASGLSYDTTLGFLRNASLRLDLADKLVYEIHRYSFTGGGRQNWLVHPVNRICGYLKNRFEDQAGFLLSSDAPVPLFVSEFGVDQRGVNQADNRFLSCFLTVIAEKDLDWALWALQGSYYLKSGKVGPEETYGVLDASWANPRDGAFKRHYGLLLNMTQGTS